MKKRGICKILGIALSISMAAAVIPAQAATTQDCNHGGHGACFADISKQIGDTYYVNPTHHATDYYEVHICRYCGDEHDGIHTVYENHDYERDYVTNMLVCTGCGDTYK